MESIIAIMVIGGLMGGTANWLLNAPQRTADGAGAQVPNIQLGVFGYIVVGIVASFTVPLFLSLARSGLLADAGQPEKFVEKLILGGFCIVAAFSSRAFMTSISDTVLREARKSSSIAEEARKKADAATTTADTAKTTAETARATAETATAAIVETGQQIEELADNVSEPKPNRGFAAVTDGIVPFDVAALSDTEKTVLKAAARMTFRTKEGIARDAQLTKGQAAEIIDSFVAKKLLEWTKSPKGSTRIRLTEPGIAASNDL